MLKRWGQNLGSIGKRYGSLIIVIILWELLVLVGVLDFRFFPPPSQVSQTLLELTLSGELIGHVAISIQRVALGFLVGSVFGLIIGLAMGWSRVTEQLVDPLIAVFYPIPKLALLPLILIIFGLGEASKVAIVAVAVFFTVVISAAAGVKSIEPVLLDAARNFGAKGPDMFLKVVIPASLPAIFTSLRLGLGLALVVIIAAEFVASKQGLGYMIWLSWGALATSRMYAGLITIGLIGLLSTLLLQWLGRYLMPWDATQDPDGSNPVRRPRGTGISIRSVLASMTSRVFSHSRQYLYELPIDAKLIPPKSPPEYLSFQWIDPANVSDIQTWKGRRQANLNHRNLNRGKIGIYAYDQGMVIGYVWGTVRKNRYDVCCTHQPIELNDAFTQSAEVLPEYRRLGVASFLRYLLLMRIREFGPSIGVNRIQGTVTVENTPMQKLIERQGSIPVKEFALYKFTPWFYLYYTWDLNVQRERLAGSSKIKVKVKIPEILSDPLLSKFFGRGIIQSDRDWQPQGEA